MSATIKRLKVSLGFVVLYHGIKRRIAPPGGIQMLDWTGNSQKEKFYDFWNTWKFM